MNLRYAADFREYQLFQAHIPTAYLFVPVEGPLTMHGAARRGLPAIGAYRRSDFLTTFDGGPDTARNSRRFAANVIDYLKENHLHESGARIALERFRRRRCKRFCEPGCGSETPKVCWKMRASSNRNWK